ncbi:MAG: HAD family hydrolase [Spirochaetota bacterium]
MKFFNLPEKISGLIFDIDNTLYECEEFIQAQETGLISRLAEEKGKSFSVMKAEIDLYRQKFAVRNGGKRPSLGNTFVEFGIPIPTSADWRESIIVPEDYLTVDMTLAAVLEKLSRRYGLITVTNNPVSTGKRILRALGVEAYFLDVIGLDKSGVSKPHTIPFHLAAEAIGVKPANCVSIGDRYEVDIEIPLSMGMGGVLVEGIQDTYNLTEVL